MVKKIVVIMAIISGVHGAIAMELDNKPVGPARPIATLKNLSLHAVARACLMPINLENIKAVHDTLETYNVAIAPEDFKDIMATDASHLSNLNQTLPICCMSQIKTASEMKFSPDDSCIACNGHNGPSLFDIKEQKFYQLERADEYGTFHFSARGTYLCQWIAGNAKDAAKMHEQDKLAIWDIKSRKLLKMFNAAECHDRVRVCTTPDEKYFIVQNRNETFAVYNPIGWQKVCDLPCITLHGTCFSPDSSRIAIPKKHMIDGVCRVATHVCDVATGQVITVLAGGDAIAFSPDGKYIATELYDNSQNQSCLHIYQGDGYYLALQKYERVILSKPEKITFNSDATKLLIESRRDCSVWDIAQKQCVFHQGKKGTSSLLVCDDMTKVVEAVDSMLTVKLLDGTLLQQVPIAYRTLFERIADGKYLIAYKEWNEGAELYNLDDLHDHHILTAESQNTSLSRNGNFFIGRNELVLVGLSPSPATFKELLAAVVKKSEKLGSPDALTKAVTIKKIAQENNIKRFKFYGLLQRLVIDDGYNPTMYDTQSNNKLTIAMRVYSDLSMNNGVEQFVYQVWDDAENSCAICLEKNIDEVTKCKHLFHKECLALWLVNHDSCPTCRCDLKKY